MEITLGRYTESSAHYDRMNLLSYSTHYTDSMCSTESTVGSRRRLRSSVQCRPHAHVPCFPSESARDVARWTGVRTVRRPVPTDGLDGESVVIGPLNRCGRRIPSSNATARSFDTKIVWEYRLAGRSRWRYCRRSGSSYPESLLTIGRRWRPLVDIIHSRPIPRRSRSLTSSASGPLRTAARIRSWVSRSRPEPALENTWWLILTVTALGPLYSNYVGMFERPRGIRGECRCRRPIPCHVCARLN